MARTGLRIAKYNILDVENNKYAALTDNKVPVFEKMIDFKPEIEKNDVKLYANDTIAEIDTTFKSGKLSMTIADDEDTLIAKILGHKVNVNGQTGQIEEGVYDTSPYCGFGVIVTKVVNGANKFKVVFLPKIKFTKVTEEATTRADGVEFKTIPVEAVIFTTDSAIGKVGVDVYKVYQTFDTYTQAVTYLDSLLTPTA